jgi:kynurenine formamidase
MVESAESVADVPEDVVRGWFDALSNWGRWGADDEAGTLNLIRPEHRVAAAALVRDGIVIPCGKLLTVRDHIGEPPLHGPPQHFMVQCGEQFAGRDNEPHKLQSAKDYFGLMFHNLSVTHLDAVAHVFWNGVAYNGRSAATCTSEAGCTFGSVDVARDGIVSRGVLLDIARLRNVDWVTHDRPIRRAELEAAERDAGVHVGPGDVLLVRTGIAARIAAHGATKALAEGIPGLGADCLPFVHERGVAVLCGDTGSDALPSPYATITAPIHQIGLVAMGLWLVDNCALEQLAEECARRGRWEFLFTLGALRIEYGTGSPVNPIAVL